MNRKQRKALQRKIKAAVSYDRFFRDDSNWITSLNARASSKYSSVAYKSSRQLWKQCRHGFAYGMSAYRMAGLLEGYGKSTETALATGRKLHASFTVNFAELEKRYDPTIQ